MGSLYILCTSLMLRCTNVCTTLHWDAGCSPPPTLGAVGKAHLESLENMVPSSFSVHELSHEQCKEGSYLHHHFAEDEDKGCPSGILTAPSSKAVKMTGRAQPLKQILHHWKRLEGESTGKSRATPALSWWPFLAAAEHFRCGILLNHLEEPVIHGRS